MRIAYVGPFSFPKDDATARRILGVSLSLADAGYDVLIGAGDRTKSNRAEKIVSDLPTSIYHLNEIPHVQQYKIKRVLSSFIWGKKTIQWLEGLFPRPDIVIMFGGFSAYCIRLQSWCRHRGVKLVIDIVEWYQGAHFPLGWLGPFSLNNEIANRLLFARTQNVIVISRYLAAYYHRKGCRVLLIPPTLDLKSVPQIKVSDSNNKVFTLAYAGNPGKKDLIDPVLEAIFCADIDKNKFRFMIAGPESEDILNMPALRSRRMSTIPDYIKVVGRVTHDDSMKIMSEADFTVLLRPQKRYANAGFPTKVVESLALGTPVICNITSDLGEIIHDGHEGLICLDHSASACLKAIYRALNLSNEEVLAMRRSARECAIEHFDYRKYTESLSQFIKQD